MDSTGGTYLVCAAVLERSDGELEGAAGDVDVVVLDAHLQQNFMLVVGINLWQP